MDGTLQYWKLGQNLILSCRLTEISAMIGVTGLVGLVTTAVFVRYLTLTTSLMIVVSLHVEVMASHSSLSTLIEVFLNEFP